jgi:hypothetical protein
LLYIDSVITHLIFIISCLIDIWFAPTNDHSSLLYFSPIHIIKVGLCGIKVSHIKLLSSWYLSNNLLLLLIGCGTLCWIVVVHSKSVLHTLALILFLMSDVRQNVFNELIWLEYTIILCVIVTYGSIINRLFIV